ncbi:hypothetical protein [Streptosporangium carneum]|uniref:Uncharacterized protein n=1 Tax=Streptosporangium carneum TaxID=47481 RepID=A0A9W6MF77_9ACTN|nr:hypothetical protein [Streptosporangium carneum]GLK12354.1 hypothetical protein GCM10017600_57640 [Streptosporangium carneum]
MTSDSTGRRGGAKLALLGIIWFTGTPLLGVLAFTFGFSLMGGTPKNAQLAAVLAVAALVLGFGAPVVGLLAALAARNRSGVWVYGMIVTAIGILAVAVLPRSDGPAYREDPPVCTAPPDRAVGVPGC